VNHVSFAKRAEPYFQLIFVQMAQQTVPEDLMVPVVTGGSSIYCHIHMSAPKLVRWLFRVEVCK
jgi:hypothetical protein